MSTAPSLAGARETCRLPIFSSLRIQGRIQDFWKGVHVYNGVGVRFADLSHFSKYSKNADSGPKKLGLLKFLAPLTGF